MVVPEWLCRLRSRERGKKREENVETGPAQSRGGRMWLPHQLSEARAGPSFLILPYP